MGFNLKNIKTYTDGKASFIVGLCEQINLPQVFDKYVEKHSGRPPYPSKPAHIQKQSHL